MTYKALINSDIYSYVKQLEIKTKKLVYGRFSGLYNSSLKGSGINFSGFREYVYGDDTKNISWPVTARTGKTYLKEFEEDRDLQIILLVDISASMNFGSINTKKEISAYLSALLAFTAIKNKDKVGLLLFSDELEYFIKPQKNKQNVYNILFNILSYKSKKNKSDLNSSVAFLQNILKQKSYIFILSDFDFALKKNKALQILSSKHEVLALHICDQWELELPESNFIFKFANLEGAEEVFFDTSSKQSREDYKIMAKNKELLVKQELQNFNIPKILIQSNKNWSLALIAFFNR